MEVTSKTKIRSCDFPDTRLRFYELGFPFYSSNSKTAVASWNIILIFIFCDTSALATFVFYYHPTIRRFKNTLRSHTFRISSPTPPRSWQKPSCRHTHRARQIALTVLPRVHFFPPVVRLRATAAAATTTDGFIRLPAAAAYIMIVIKTERKNSRARAVGTSGGGGGGETIGVKYSPYKHIIRARYTTFNGQLNGRQECSRAVVCVRAHCRETRIPRPKL